MHDLDDIDDIDDLDQLDLDAVLRTFAAESEEQARTMEESLLALEHRPGDADAVRAILRAVHTLKGNAGTLGFRELAAFAHTLEDLLEQLVADPSALRRDRVTLLLRGVDAIRALVSSAIAGDHELQPAHRALIARLGEEVAALRHAAAERPGVTTSDRPATVQGAPRGPSARTLRVDVDKLDRLLDLASEIALARARLGRIIEECDDEARALADAHDEATRLQHDLQELVLQMRVMPVGPTLRRFARMVRDHAAEQGKEARLEIAGAELEVDSAVLEHLGDPLTHLVRNALDHGIESADTRQAAGKDRVGRITLRARQEGEMLVVEVADDGAGLDRARIAERARTSGVADIATLGDRELCRLILEPGFSTVERAGPLSGRGVGLDVVRRHVEALSGAVEIDSAARMGTTVTLRVPLTVATVSGVAVGVGGRTYLVPADSVRACLPGDGPEPRDATALVVRGGRAVPHLSLREQLGASTGATGAAQSAAPPDERTVIVTDGVDEVALLVDRLIGECRAVVRPASAPPDAPPGVVGTGVLGDGQVALLLDIAALLRDARRIGALASLEHPA